MHSDLKTTSEVLQSTDCWIPAMKPTIGKGKADVNVTEARAGVRESLRFGDAIGAVIIKPSI